MALIKLGIVVSEISGKLNGGVFAKNRGGAYVRTKVTPTNPQTQAQVQARSKLATFSQKWRTLTEAQLASWRSVVDQWTRTNVFGDVTNPSGSALFTRLNVNIALAGGAPIVVPPTPLGVPSLQTIDVEAEATVQALALQFTASPIPAGMVLYVEATPQMSKGIFNANSKYRHLVTLPAATATGEDILTEYTEKFGALAAGQKLFVRAKLIRIATGEVSQVLSTSVVVAA